MIEYVEEHDRIPALVNGFARMDQNSTFLNDILKILLISKSNCRNSTFEINPLLSWFVFSTHKYGHLPVTQVTELHVNVWQTFGRLNIPTFILTSRPYIHT